MATATWRNTGETPAPPTTNEPPAAGPVMVVDSLSTWTLDGTDMLIAQTSIFQPGDRIGALTQVVDGNTVTVAGALVTLEIRDQAKNLVHTAEATTDADGNALGVWQTTAPRGRGRRATAGTPAGTYTAEVTNVVEEGYTFELTASALTTFTIQ